MKFGTTLALALVLMVTGGLLAGCESDPVAPNDELPAPTPQAAARQAGLAAIALTEVGPAVLSVQNKDVRLWNFSGDVEGHVTLDFRCGSSWENGSPCDDEVSDWARAWTDKDSPLRLTPQNFAFPVGEMTLAFNLEGEIANDHESALVSTVEPGVFTAGEYKATWEIEDVLVRESEDYPGSGLITFTLGVHTAVLEFNGTDTVTITVDEVDVFTFVISEGSLIAS